MDRRNSVEIQAISVEEAVRLALEQLGRGRDDVEIEVLAEPSGGGGLDEEEALVRVTVRGFASQPTRVPGGGRRMPPGRPAPAPPRAMPDEEEDLGDPDEVTATALTVTRELLGSMGFQVRVVPQRPADDAEESGPPTVGVNILGNDLGVLIGRRGEYLAQLQYLVNLLVNRRVGEWTRVSLDVEGYKRRREESLIGLAERVARQVERSGRPIQLEPMPPNERRIVHLALRDEVGVSTESSGEGDLRRVVIAPKR
ncbi:MAG: RNA-binding protein Jag [uncultured Thermomicrobiales bacterium]|uniref:RNA-binding protein KhpB n=1 Tax=uncultured Thermomicrobiales bacterium TaxID=1645740 RepID=A0A6N3IPD7_9BACT|nr:MAG: RNA-binding protein Jag [uncultured Thermomicrobiales bacterium]